MNDARQTVLHHFEKCLMKLIYMPRHAERSLRSVVIHAGNDPICLTLTIELQKEKLPIMNRVSELPERHAGYNNQITPLLYSSASCGWCSMTSFRVVPPFLPPKPKRVDIRFHEASFRAGLVVFDVQSLLAGGVCGVGSASLDPTGLSTALSESSVSGGARLGG